MLIIFHTHTQIFFQQKAKKAEIEYYISIKNFIQLLLLKLRFMFMNNKFLIEQQEFFNNYIRKRKITYFEYDLQK